MAILIYMDSSSPVSSSSASSEFDFRAFHAQHKVGMIVACSENGVIGDSGDLPWSLPRDLKHFMQSTRGCPVVMGRKTFDTLDNPLPNRLNIILSRSMSEDQPEGVRVARDIEDGIRIGQGSGLEAPVWIAGGGDIYRQAMNLVDLIVCTRVHAHVSGDTVFPEIDQSHWHLAHSQCFESDDRHVHSFTIEWWESVESR